MTRGIGIVGAGRFAAFLADAVADLPGVRVAAVADIDRRRSAALASELGARAVPSWRDLIADPEVSVVAITTPPSSHADLACAALGAGRHVLCEKPLATHPGAAAAVRDAAEHSGRVLVVDHVLRYNPLLQALARLRGALLGPMQRFCLENDASDEDLAQGHWFWEEAVSGGIFLEHGVHFFDAAHLLARTLPEAVTAMTAARPDGTIDTASATARHPGGMIATHTHGFSHAHRCEHQLMRMDHGTAEVRVDGWIPVHAVIDAWTDDAGADVAEALSNRAGELFAIRGHRLGADAGITARVHRHAGSRTAVGRGETHVVPHHVRAVLTLGGAAAKQRVYRESVRAAVADLLHCADTGTEPRSGAREGWAAVVVADAARRAAATGSTVRLDGWLPPTRPSAGPAAAASAVATQRHVASHRAPQRDVASGIAGIARIASIAGIAKERA